MTHATAEQVHDHVFGFRRSAHVESCVDCSRAAAVVAGELDALRDVLSAPPKARAKVGPASLAAAALLLATLSWLLFQPPDRAVPAGAAQEEEMARLVAEFKGTSPVRRDIARLALKRYGASAVEAMTRAQVDPAFIDEVQGITPDDRKLIDRLKSTRITLNLEKVLYSEICYQLAEAVGVTDMRVPGLDLETAFMSFKVDNVTVQEAFQKFCGQVKQPFGGVQYGKIVIGRPMGPPSFSPVRLPAKPEEVARRIEQLSDDVPARREEAALALRRLGFAAERALWKAIDSDSKETRSRSADLLRLLYTTNPAMDVPIGWRSVPRITAEASNRPMEEFLVEMADQVGASMIRDSRISLANERVSFKVQDITLDGAVRLLLGPRGFNGFATHDCILIAPEGTAAQLWTALPHARWAESKEARALETLIADLASADPARQEKAAREFMGQDAQSALDVLAYATGTLEGEALARVQRLRRTIAEKQGLWIQDLPSGADLQKLTPAQSALLDGRVTRPDRPLTVAELLKADGVRCQLKAEPGGSYHVGATAPKRSSFLKIVLRSRGLDFYMDGETLVIDTAANVRAAVEK